MIKQPWESEQRCPGDRGKCEKLQIDGLGFCIHHVDEEDLAEAEMVTGQRRCRRCSYLATKGSNPPMCPLHVRESMTGGHATNRANYGEIEYEATQRVSGLLAEHGERLLNPPDIGDPLDALMRLAAEISAFRQILTEEIAKLGVDQWRYAHHRAGEQIRATLVLYDRALDRQAKILTSIAKLRIAEHKLQLERELAEFILQQLTIALEASGLDLVGQQKAREHLSKALADIVT